MFVRARAPLRLGLAGGGTDVSPYCDTFGGLVLNATIDKYAYTTLEPGADARVRLIAADRQERWEGEAESELTLDGTLDLHKGVYNRIVRDFNCCEPLSLTLTTHTDAPPGSGLGSSSTLVVSMVKAFVEWLNLPLGEYDIARLAYDIERVDVGLSGGRQDQYAATFGGFNFMEFHPEERVVVNPLRIKNWILSELEASLLLYFGGVSRESAQIIDEQSANVRRQDTTAIEAMHSLKQEALAMKENLLRGDFAGLIESMEAGWQAKKRMARSISNPEIEEIYELTRRAGARAGKISGAGGGGFMMLLVEPVRRMDVMRALQQTRGQIYTCHFTKHGTEGWKIY
ncbi:dehydrogenase [Thiocystis violascens]|uniref:Putative kinase, galactokinase/mevalonate kinase n=1 Tax=Thiocystis violascens (strain ATCC 17096 / DSM 198 / 6111) TaxID=765911 RepID=I3YFV1_THIV6|nr:dehydrogenase [Thiocystis violascens]AFL75869.1 putative kinase, galactokinase/mevalonate kinase [Thiocystis violascens DSM 198]